MRLLAFLFCILALNAQAVIIYGEETPDMYIKVTEYRGKYIFDECEGLIEENKCFPLLGNMEFTREEINRLSNDKYVDGSLTVALNGVSLFGGAIFGALKGVKIATKFYRKRGYSMDGCPNCIGVVGSVPGAGAVGIAQAIIDDLDPFIDYDLGKAYEAAIGIASEGDLEDIEARKEENELVVTVEDVNFMQLREKIYTQLLEVRD
ncbi:MAG: hypothetical protein VX341_08430 [Bdellovibrionota bacterium]|nr:hypothetical protein [Bdellovibrionota bacterium]